MQTETNFKKANEILIKEKSVENTSVKGELTLGVGIDHRHKKQSIMQIINVG